ncbi:MAG TPA: class I SAM-dependent methyltransferase [Candidatus Acidoferrales bacterium]|nr:class I SAM-dependent methyltransferase [Candidatus Acidoferrales bacterium]
MRVNDCDAVGWDVGNWSRALRYWEREGALEAGSLQCLEVGASGGGISVWLALRGHHVVCSDYNKPLSAAKVLADRYGVADRLQFENIDATSIPYEDTFDVVTFKSVLNSIGHDGAIDRQQQAVAAMYRALRPGGRLLFAENLVGSPLHGLLRRTYVPWGARCRYITTDEMRAFLAPFSQVRYGTAGFLATLGRSESQRQALSVVDRVIDRAIPPAWRYIIYGVAVK